jgi:hypothetical protein
LVPLGRAIRVRHFLLSAAARSLNLGKVMRMSDGRAHNAFVRLRLRWPRGTLFAWHKLPLKIYLMAIALFCNEVEGMSMLAFCRDLDVRYKTAFVLAAQTARGDGVQHEGAAHRRRRMRR